MCLVVIGSGASIAYNGSRETLFEDLALVKPTFFCGVPRVFNTVYAKVLEQVSQQPAWKQWLFKTALEQKTGNQSFGR